MSAQSRKGIDGAIAMLLAMEVGTEVWFLENLTLNVIMLIHPIEAIKARQSARRPGL